MVATFCRKKIRQPIGSGGSRNNESERGRGRQCVSPGVSTWQGDLLGKNSEANGGGSLHPSPLNPPLNLGKSGAVVYRAVCNLRFVFTVAAEWQVTENITHMPCWPPPIPGSIKTTLQCWGLKERKSSTWGRPGSYLTPGFQRSVSVAVAVAVSVKTVSVQAVYADAAGAGARQ